VSQVYQWDRCFLGGIELPGHVSMKRKLISELQRNRNRVIILPDGYAFEFITPSGDDLARWEGEGGAL
jgi:hypothetical protein